jgi:hypothetical protein
MQKDVPRSILRVTYATPSILALIKLSSIWRPWGCMARGKKIQFSCCLVVVCSGQNVLVRGHVDAVCLGPELATPWAARRVDIKPSSGTLVGVGDKESLHTARSRVCKRSGDVTSVHVCPQCMHTR